MKRVLVAERLYPILAGWVIVRSVIDTIIQRFFREEKSAVGEGRLCGFRRDFQIARAQLVVAEAVATARC